MAPVKTDNAGDPGTVSGGLTAKSVVAGGTLSILSCIWAVHTSYNASSSLITIGHLPIAAIVPFAFVALLVNPILKLKNPLLAFSSRELLVIFFLVFTASAIPGWAFSSYWLGR